MKKAFEDNLPRQRPRVRLGSSQPSPLDARPDEVAESAVRAATLAESSFGPSVDVRAAVEAALRSHGESGEEHGPIDPRAEAEQPDASRPPSYGSTSDAGPLKTGPTDAQPRATASAGPDALGAELRRRKLRSRLTALTAASPEIDPESPKAAAELLGTAEAVMVELTAARERGERLASELTRARADLDGVVAEVERRRRDQSEATARLGEARALLATLEIEMAALEEERGEALLAVGALRAADSARVEQLTRTSEDLDGARRQLAELRSERAELLRELEAEEVESASLRRKVAQLDAEKSHLEADLSEASRSRSALADSRKALEEVHRVLAVARAPRR